MNSSTSVATNNLEKDEQEKKMYQRPELLLYGNISEITKAVDMMGNTDGGVGMMTKT